MNTMINKSFYESLYEQYIPGFSPLEQAIAIHYQLEEKIRKDSNLKKRPWRGYNIGFDRGVWGNPNINGQLEMNELSSQKKMDILNKVSIIGGR